MQEIAICAPAQLWRAVSSQLRHVLTIKKLVKQQYLLVSSQYGELRPTSGWDQLATLGHCSKFQPVLRLGFISAPTLLNGGQPNFAHVWPSPALLHCIYIFGGSCPVTEFCQVQNSLCVQVLRSPTLAMLLHSIRAVGVKQTLRHGTRNGITELLQTVPHILGRAVITMGIGYILVSFILLATFSQHCYYLVFAKDQKVANTTRTHNCWWQLEWGHLNWIWKQKELCLIATKVI